MSTFNIHHLVQEEAYHYLANYYDDIADTAEGRVTMNVVQSLMSYPLVSYVTTVPPFVDDLNAMDGYSQTRFYSVLNDFITHISLYLQCVNGNDDYLKYYTEATKATYENIANSSLINDEFKSRIQPDLMDDLLVFGSWLLARTHQSIILSAGKKHEREGSVNSHTSR